MTVVEVESLPLGFRFRPTDEELVNHYLKSKITGDGSPDVHVIPEVDLSKCEPWDLPDKSLIKSDDLEWFFFAPRDRKYPNGHRSNRATGAGYWKATGKDRIIRSRSRENNQLIVIGIKKTLVFHRGRAPRGIRTGWIMHEYRTTEPEYESGKQGGYVLYRLFNKEEERTSVKDENETDEIISSRVGERQNEEEANADLQEDTPSFSEFTSTLRPSHLDNCYAELADSSVTSSIVIPSAFDQGLKDTPEDGSMHVPTEQPEQVDDFPNVTSPLRPYTDHPFPNSLNCEDYMKLLHFNNFSNPELTDNLLDSVLPNPPNFSITNPPQDVNEVMYWPYEQLESKDVSLDYSSYEHNEATTSGVPAEETGITILGRGVNWPTDGIHKSPQQPPQGNAKRRIRLWINELCGGSCTVPSGNGNKVLQPLGGDPSLVGKLEDLSLSDGAKTKAEVLTRNKLPPKGDNQTRRGIRTCNIWYGTRFALCILLVSLWFGLWRINTQEA